ncbi:MAG: diguanylate cyclase [Nitrospirae bacterium]|nr:diguanylate cyclase [Nitrospirota bacterium]
MKLETKFSFSHGVILVFLIINGVIAVLMLNSFRNTIDKLVNDRYPKTALLDDMLYAVRDIGLSSNKLLIIEDDTLRKKELDNIEKYKNIIIESKGKLTSVIKSKEGKLLLKAISDTQEIYFSILREYTNSIILGKFKESKELLINKQTASSNMLTKTMLDLTDFQTKRMEESELESSALYNIFMLCIIFALVLSIIISTLIAARVIKSFINELGAEPHEIIDILDNISQGNLHIDYKLLKNQNQKGILKNINSMLDKLKERDILLSSEISLGKQIAKNITELKQREILQDTIKYILELSLEQIPLKNKLERIIDIVVSVPNIGLENKGCIHITVDNSEELMMAAQRNLHKSLLKQCARISYGQCLCGIAASTHKIVFSNKIDELHNISYEGMHEHGHYCVPIKSGNKLLGTLCVYVKHNHERTKLEEDFFIAISNSIASIIEHGAIEDTIKRHNIFIDTVINSINDSIAVIDVKDFTIVSTNNKFLKEYRVYENDVVGKHCYMVIHNSSEPCNQQEYSCPVMNMLRTGEYSMSEHLHYDKDGKEIYVSCSASPIKDENGNVTQCVYVLRNITQRKYYEKQLQLLAHYDTVTSLPNRILLLDRLNTSIEFAKREKYKMALLFIDLDNFKAVNDNYGHQTGDVLLKDVSKRLLSIVRKTDTVSRIGGDEFIIILSKISEQNDVVMIADKIISSLNTVFLINEYECHIGASIGIEVYPFGQLSDEIDNLSSVFIKRADMAMYKAKELGKNRYMFYDNESTDECADPLFEIDRADS